MKAGKVCVRKLSNLKSSIWRKEEFTVFLKGRDLQLLLIHLHVSASKDDFSRPAFAFLELAIKSSICKVLVLWQIFWTSLMLGKLTGDGTP